MTEMIFQSGQSCHGDAGQSELVRRIRDLREELNWYYHRIELEQLRRKKVLQRLINCRKKRSPRERAFANAAGTARERTRKRHPRSSADFSLPGCSPLCPGHGVGRILFERGPTYSRGGHARDDQNHRHHVVSRSSTFFTCFVFSFRNFAWEPLTLTALSSRCSQRPRAPGSPLRRTHRSNPRTSQRQASDLFSPRRSALSSLPCFAIWR